MKTATVNKLPPGMYRVFWKEKHGGGESFAAVGVTNDGGRWLAPINWVAPTVDQDMWRAVKKVEVLCMYAPIIR